MKLPLILPPDLAFLQQARSEADLFAQVTDNFSRAIDFFSYALDDVDWCEMHPEFLERIERWLSDLYSKDLLGYEAIQKIKTVSHLHASTLRPYLYRDMTLKVNQVSYPVNSLLLAAVSPYFNRLMRREEVKQDKELSLTIEDPEVAALLIEVTENGSHELWRLSEGQLTKLLIQAKRWEMAEVAEVAERLLARYVTAEKSLETLKKALKKGWVLVAEAAADAFNESSFGLKLHLGPEHRLVAQFLDFKRLTTLATLTKLSEEVTICQLTGKLPASPDSVLALEGIKRLWGVDLSETEAPFEHYEAAPETLHYLNLDRASWLTDDWLERLLSRFARLTHLSLKDQTRLTFLGLASLARLEGLLHLNLSGQKGLKDSELSLLSIHDLPLESLNLTGCKTLTPQAIQNFLSNAPKLRTLILDNTSTDDRCLAEISVRLSQLENLSLQNAPVTEKGLQSLLRQKPHLKLAR
jgi:hypothetical protein